MSQGFYTWSHTASANANADASINFAEGQAPSSVNDSARALMARASEYRDDIAGAIVTGGISTAYTVSSFQVFDSLAHLNGMAIAFTPHTTNGATVTLAVDSLGAKPLRSSPGVELLAGTIIQGTPYVATYNNSDGAFYLQSFFGASPYLVPLLAGFDYWDTIAPNSSFIFPAGQAISRTTYATAFARWSTKFGSGDGSTTFNVPDKTGRTSVMIEASATRLTSTYFGGDSTALGAVGGGESHVLTTAEMPVHNHGVTDPNHSHSFPLHNSTGPGSSSFAGACNDAGALTNGTTAAAATGITIQNAGSGNAHRTVQPSIATNYVLRII